LFFFLKGLVSKSELFFYLLSTCEFGCVDEYVCLAKDTPLALIKALENNYILGMPEDLILATTKKQQIFLKTAASENQNKVSSQIISVEEKSDENKVYKTESIKPKVF